MSRQTLDQIWALIYRLREHHEVAVTVNAPPNHVDPELQTYHLAEAESEIEADNSHVGLLAVIFFDRHELGI